MRLCRFSDVRKFKACYKSVVNPAGTVLWTTECRQSGSLREPRSDNWR